jgi:rRNA maturation RNase YbeY
MARHAYDGGQLNTTFSLSQTEGLAPLSGLAEAALLSVAAQGAMVHNLPAEVLIVFVTDEYMAELNTNYRAKEGTTDVLSFDLGATPGQPSSGEIYISLPQAERQALALTVPVFEEVARLLIHGLLHLAGWIHDTRDQLLAMEGETERFLNDSELNIPL